MKTMINFAGSLLILTSFLFLTTCKEEENSNPFDDEARQQYEAIINLQDESADVLLNFQSTMDSTAAVSATAEWFRNNSTVQSATVSSQGISVVYTNGIWGGLFIDGERYDMDSTYAEALCNHPTESMVNHQKNTPSPKKANLFAFNYKEFAKANIYQHNNWLNAFSLVSYNSFIHHDFNVIHLLYYINSGGIICFDSHGYAWPDNTDIKEVYLQTCDHIDYRITEKYYQDILDNDIILLESLKDQEIRYWIGPGFIKKYADFSKDTVLFYGGFCYSFLGTWPSLVNSCASGTYFGFDWAVSSGNCAIWAIDLIQKMADKSAPEPWTVEDWMTNSPIEKQYFSQQFNRTVRILYEGNGALTLWEKEESGEGVIEAVAADGAPIGVPGTTCQEYTLRCKMDGQLPPQVSYTWDISEGNAKNLGQTGNELTCLYIFPGTHPIKVEVKNSASGEVIKEITGQVQFTDPSFLPELQELNKLWAGFDPNAVHLTNGFTAPNNCFSFDTSDPFFTTPLTWADSLFSAQVEITSGSTYTLRNLSGEVSSDGQTLKHMRWTITEKTNDVIDFEVILELADIPIFVRDEWNCFYGFHWGIHGAEAQGYVVDIQYRDYNYQTQEWITIQNIEWGSSYLYGYFEFDN